MTPFLRFCFGSILVATLLAGCQPYAQPQGASPPPLALVQTIPLADVRGRIDHLAVDLRSKKLFVAELENGTVEAIDLNTGKSAGRLSGLREPQGVGYLTDRDELVVASGDGYVGFYRGADLSLAGKLQVGDDADNVRFDAARGLVVVGYGDGALAIIDPATRMVTATALLPSHPESFRLDDAHRRAFVNLPGAGKIAVVDLDRAKVITTYGAAYAAHYPLLYDATTNSFAAVYRLPARLVISNADTGAKQQDLDVCGDADDLFLDAKRHSIYVSCGSGDLDVFVTGANNYRRTARIKTSSGARTSLFVPELDRLYVAARATNGKPAAILVFEPK